MGNGVSATKTSVRSTKKASKKSENKLLASIEQKPYFAAENFVLYHDDCLKFIEELPENSIDMIFADPPYNLSNGGFTVHAGKRVSVHKGDWDVSRGPLEDFNFHMNWIEICKKVLKPEGTIWISGTYHSIYACGHALQLAGYKVLNDITWFKPNASPNLSGRYFAAAHETLIWARKDPNAKHYFDYEAMKRDDWFESDDQIKKTGKQMRSVWRINTPRPEEKIHSKHPTQKPLNLLRRIVKATSKEGAIILDPFTGSSTTGLAAVEYNRKFIGIDTQKEYLDLSVKRYQDLFKQSQIKL